MPELQPEPKPAAPLGALRVLRRPVFVALVVLFVGGALLLSVWLLRPRLTEEQIATAVITTLARESPASFYVTGTLTFVTTTEGRSEKTLLPGLLNLDLGETRATVRVPGRVAYGFDVRSLGPEHIRYTEDGVVEVDVPALTVFSVEPELERAEIETDVGWARLYRSSGRDMEQLALREIRPAMRATAEGHLARSETPGLNTAEALARLLTPPLEAAGVAAPRFRFRLSPDVVLEVEAPPREAALPG